MGDATIAVSSASVSLEYRASSTWTLQAGLGASFGGALRFGDTRYAVQPGGLLSAGASWRILEGRGWEPFLFLSVGFAASASSTADPSGNDGSALVSLDFRASLVVGKTLDDVLSPYLALRAFGGPIFWRARGAEQLGTDQYHYQIGAGLVFAAAPRVDVFFEVAPFGERRVSGGMGFAF